MHNNPIPNNAENDDLRDVINAITKLDMTKKQGILAAIEILKGTPEDGTLSSSNEANNSKNNRTLQHE